jgi:hypothetical protein
MKVPLTSPDRSAISVGNAALTGRDNAGWFVGRFISEEAGIRRSEAVEVKWGLHTADEVRAGVNDQRGMYSLSILIAGKFMIEFPTLGEEVMLSQTGDYVMYGPGVAHSWRAVDASTVLTVRWAAPEAR